MLARLLGGLALLALASGCAAAGPVAATPPAAPAESCLTGFYEGSAMEIAAMLELGEGGRFRYALAYGALDERAQGRWSVRGETVRLTSDPVTPPELALVARGHSPDGRLHLTLDLPEGLSRQYFDAELRFANGREVVLQFGEEGLEITAADYLGAQSLRVTLPLHGVASEPVPAPDAGTLSFRFVPNDLGSVAFDDFALPLQEGALRLDRHGRSLRLIPGEGSCQPR